MARKRSTVDGDNNTYVVLLHFDAPVDPNGKNPTARHYLEYAANIDARLADHVAGDRTRTSGIMYACYMRNIGFTVARVWIGTRRDEYRLRQLGKNPKLCPICNPSLNLHTTRDADTGIYTTLRTINPDAPRYGDIETLKPYTYKPKHRTRTNGESNRTSGNASTWRADTKIKLYAPQPPMIDECTGNDCTRDHLHTLDLGIRTPIDCDFAVYGFE